MRALRTSPVIGQVTVLNADGSSFSLWVREEDLPPEVNEMRKAKIKRAINQIRQTLANEQQKD